MPIIQTKAAIDTRLAAFETQLKADTEANVLAIEADQQAKEAAKIESDILLEDALVAANQEREIAREASATQRMSYLKSGVLLEGSPLVVLEETFQKGEENARNILEGSRRQAAVINKRGGLTTPLINRASLTATTAGISADVATGTTKFIDQFRQIV